MDLTSDPIAVAPSGEEPVTPFRPGVPGGWTMGQRGRRAAAQVADIGARAAIDGWLAGRPQLAGGNGLGFDVRRIRPGEGPVVEPVAELLALAALPMFPVARPDPWAGGGPPAQRGWRKERSGWVFRWPAWSQPLDIWAIDAVYDAGLAPGARPDASSPPLEDLGPADRAAHLARLGVTAVFATVAFKPRGPQDPTRGYASRLDIDVEGLAVTAPDGSEAPRGRGRPATQPHGTLAGYRRHRRRGEGPCAPCAAAASAWNRANYQARKTNEPWQRNQPG